MGSPKTKKSYFLKFFGEHPLVRIVDFLIDNFAFDYTKTDIAKYSNVSWSTLYQYWNRLEDNGVVIKTRSVGNATLYKINTENPLVKELLKTDFLLSSSERVIKSKKAEIHI